MKEPNHINPNIISYSERYPIHYVCVNLYGWWKVMELEFYRKGYPTYLGPTFQYRLYDYKKSHENIALVINYRDRFFLTTKGYRFALKRCIIKNNRILNKIKKYNNNLKNKLKEGK